ncbi:iron-containing alcohol dehydrogenase [Feifania hominis]|uniref:Iron-containing alcohol dehydrogenase n=1 Tax=Feifania hominis TaxID=2763660 RepID=A0A926HUA8_9FIRM|nr:iron-containing alcohol dehydrogenase [Feifania hominis]MBC8536719.1 iron-containing alcohol dehydrogenase [Feifania hominis]
MQDFMFCAPTQIFFGKTALDKLAGGVKKYGNRVLMVYGGGSIKRFGLYDKVVKIFQDNDISFMELSGVEPNPKMGLVREGIKLCRDNNLDVVLAVGGGSAIDTAKAVAAGVHYDGDIAELVGQEYFGKILPILTILTMSGSGSEMTTSTVLNNEATGVKAGFHGPDVRPRISYLNPEFTYTAPKRQIAAGVADGMSHVFESYFSNEKGAYLQARFSEAILKTLFQYGETAVKDPENYEARANVMLANTWACNGVVVKGNYVMWATHIMEHPLSAVYPNLTHGEGLACLTPPWMRWTLDEERAYRYVDFGVNVLGIDRNLPDMEIANKAIDITEDYFFNKLGMPRRLRDLGVEESRLPELAQLTMNRLNDKAISIMYKPMHYDDCLEIFKAAF